MKPDNFFKFNNFRREFPEFIYENYSVLIDNEAIKISFTFSLSDKYFFKPTINIPVKKIFFPENMTVDILRPLVFNIGMIELISYWKAACPPRILIRPHHISSEQIKWWKKLYFLGLGEFFYRNDIIVNQEDFVDIISEGKDKLEEQQFNLAERMIVPVGGGKDSIVTMQLLAQSGEHVIPFVLNPGVASRDCIKTGKFSGDGVIEFYRTLDPALLKLNDQGYLNGHTPFSALLAFMSGLAAVLTGASGIALSNESSANEATVRDTKVNHQYSKTFEFESDFRTYFHKFISTKINYFSFLRPLNELQIAGIFSKYPEFHRHFMSCNVGSKTDTWCGRCPKCLFTFIILAPFITMDDLISVFGEDLLDNAELKPVFDQLIGLTEEKPFECIGTIDEVNIAICMILNQLRNEKIPFLLEYYQGLDQFKVYCKSDPQTLLRSYNNKNFLPDRYVEMLKSAIL